MNVHLKENGFLRSVFGLDDPEAEVEKPTKGNRFERVCFSHLFAFFKDDDFSPFFSPFSTLSNWQIEMPLNYVLKH